MAVLMAGTANGRARWIDVERGLLKADVYCRPLGKSMVRILCVGLSIFCLTVPGAARYNTCLLNKLTPKGL